MLSRVADSVYWMARYIERAENVARYVDVALQSSLDGPNSPGKQWMPLVAAAGDQGMFLEKYGESVAAREGGEAVMRFLAFDQDYPNSIVSCVSKARENARQVRGSLALEAWEHLNKFYHYLISPDARRRALESPFDFFSEIRTASYLFEGIVESTMSRGEEWNFMKLGRMLERADQTSRILDVKYFILLPNPSDVGSVVDDLLWAALLHSVSGYEMFRRRHGRILPEKVVDFLVLDREFPRAVLYCLERAEECLLNLSGTPMGSFRNNAEKQVSRLRSTLAYTNVEEVISQGLHEFLDRLQNGLNEVGEGIFESFFALDTQSQYQFQQA
ncbi:MAG: alpha-E domain-containing protein [Fibrobacteria bacterium]